VFSNLIFFLVDYSTIASDTKYSLTALEGSMVISTLTKKVFFQFCRSWDKTWWWEAISVF